MSELQKHLEHADQLLQQDQYKKDSFIRLVIREAIDTLTMQDAITQARIKILQQDDQETEQY